MHIIHEDEKRLEFKVYPPNEVVYWLLFFLVVIVLLFFIYPSAWVVLAIFFLLILAFLLVIYIFPIHVVVDNVAQKLTYFDLTLFYEDPKQGDGTRQHDAWSLTMTIPLNHLIKIEFTNDPREIYGNNLSVPMTANRPVEGKIHFVLDNTTTKDIFLGEILLSSKVKASQKIAKYLDIPFEEKIKPLTV